MQYLTDWRMALARDHLRSGELGMAAIARTIGYSSPYAFAAAFRRHHGEPPGAWRQREALRERELPPRFRHTLTPPAWVISAVRRFACALRPGPRELARTITPTLGPATWRILNSATNGA